ncbi:hypothetical protein FRC01_002466 [Tulasnella sp. 417]|nr:hypothetical protein FRC01_002466 [Tulasnella sp. 417]
MKGPSGHSVFEATRTLLRSIHEENKAIREATLDRPDVESHQRFLEDADNNLIAMELTLEAVRHELGSQIVAARRKRNPLFPIFRLPPELLLKIFHAALDSHLTCGVTNPSYLGRLKTLASVCSPWLTFVRSTPSLWAVLESSCSITFLPVVIRNSKSALLNIRSDWDPHQLRSFTYRDKEHHRQFLQTITEPGLTERWSSVYIDLPHDTGPIKELMEGSFPNLRSIYFGQAQSGWKQGPVKLLGGDTGRLREFRVNSMPLQWDAITLTGLRLLDLTGEAPNSSAKLLDLLAASPSLESLSLTGLPAPFDSGQEKLGAIDLLQLRELFLMNNEAESIIPLLQSIRLSTLAKFRIIHRRYNKGYGDEFVSVLETLGHLNSSLQSTLKSATTLHLAVDGESIKCIANRGHEVCFEVDLTKTRSTEVFKWMSKAITPDFEGSQIRHTKLTLNSNWGGHGNQTAFLPVMEWLGNITELALYANYASTVPLKWLSERVVEGNEVRWRSPRLHKLLIFGSAYLQDVLDFAEERYGGSRGNGTVTEDGDLRVYWPDGLEYLDISGLNSDEDMDMHAEDELRLLLGCHKVIGYDGRRERGDYADEDDDDDDDDDYISLSY